MDRESHTVSGSVVPPAGGTPTATPVSQPSSAAPTQPAASTGGVCV